MSIWRENTNPNPTPENRHCTSEPRYTCPSRRVTTSVIEEIYDLLGPLSPISLSKQVRAVTTRDIRPVQLRALRLLSHSICVKKIAKGREGGRERHASRRRGWQAPISVRYNLSERSIDTSTLLCAGPSRTLVYLPYGTDLTKLGTRFTGINRVYTPQKSVSTQ